MGTSADLSTVRRVHIVGRKNSGKTTLIVEIIECLAARGMRIGTIKHTHHHHELDTPGKDSHRHRQAGAAVVGIMAPGMDAIFWPQSSLSDDQGRYDRLLPLFADCDLLLVEGHLTGLGLKVEVWRAATSNQPVALSDPSILAVVSDDRIESPVPFWSRSDVSSLADRVLDLAFKGGL